MVILQMFAALELDCDPEHLHLYINGEGSVTELKEHARSLGSYGFRSSYVVELQIVCLARSFTCLLIFTFSRWDTKVSYKVQVGGALPSSDTNVSVMPHVGVSGIATIV
jgi:hypothetical protein